MEILIVLGVVFIITQFLFLRSGSKIIGIVLPAIWFTVSLGLVITVSYTSLLLLSGKFTVKFICRVLITLAELNLPTYIMLTMLFIKSRKEKHKNNTDVFFI